MKINNNLTGTINIDNTHLFPFPPFKIEADLLVEESNIVWEENKKSINFKIKNRGIKESTAFYISILYKLKNKNPKTLIKFWISSLDAGKSLSKSFDLMTYANRYTNYLKDVDKLIIKVDSNNQVKEINEKNNIDIIDIDYPFKELTYDSTRQVKTTKTDYSEKIELYANGRAYKFNCKSGNYAGCGIDAAHSFMGWIDDTITRSSIKHHIETTNLTDTIFGDLKKGDTFTSPAQMSKGLTELVNAYEPHYKDKVTRHHHNNDDFVIAKIKEYLESGMPVVALINNGCHWVTIVGIDCIYNGNKLDLNSKIQYIDMTAGHTYISNYSNLKICGWSSEGERLYSSYKAGTIISIEDSKLNNSFEKKAYKFEIYTSDLEYSGTNANIHLKLMGSNNRQLSYKIDTICNDFERDSTTIQSFIVNEYLEDIHSIAISKDNAGNNSGWNISYIKITEITTEKTFYVPIHAWIDPINENVYMVEKDTVDYQIEVTTGDLENSGTDAKVYIKLYGELGESLYIQLDNDENNYEKKKVDRFNLQHKNLGVIQKIKVKHDNSGNKPGWFLEKVSIRQGSEQFNFTANEWLSSSQNGALPKVTLLEDSYRIKYTVKVKTSQAKNAGTDAGVYIQLFGTNGRSTSLQRIDQKYHDDFEKGATDTYTVYADADLGEVNKINLEHDNTGSGPWWKIDQIIINDRYTFNINAWLGDNNSKVHPHKTFRR